jgi:hypothetical protein
VTRGNSERIWDFASLSPREYTLTKLKDGSEIHIYSFGGNVSSPKRQTPVTTLHLPPSKEPATTTTGPFLARLPADVLFVSGHSACLHIFTLDHYAAAHSGRWQPVCFVVGDSADADRKRDKVGAADALWDEWRFFVLMLWFHCHG